MANEDKKDFNAMLHDNKDMPKFQVITDQKSPGVFREGIQRL